MHARVAMYEHDHNAPHHTMITSIITDLPAPFVLAVALAGVFLIAFMKGAFGGGFAIVGIAILFDRISQAWGQRLQKHREASHV